MTNTQLEAWVEALAGEFGIDTSVADVARLLDIARDSAHSVARPAAPLTTFLVGFVAGRAAVGDDGVDEGAVAEAFDFAIATAERMARDWAEEMPG